MSKGRFSKKAKTHAALSKKRTKRTLKDAARRSGPVTISYLPGFGPPETKPIETRLPLLTETKFPFRATVNGDEVWVSRGAYGYQFDYPD